MSERDTDIDPDVTDVVEMMRDGLPVAVTDRYPLGSSHGCIIGKGKDRRAWVSQQMFDAAKLACEAK